MKTKIVNVGYSYTKNEPIFRDVNFTIDDNSVVAVLGKNGVGKTTMLKCIMGIYEWDQGHLEVDGVKMPNINSLKKVAYVPQAHNITFSYSVLEFVVMGRTRYMGRLAIPSKRDIECAEQALEQMRLQDLKDKPVTKLSGGQLQLVYIARALATNPELIILDEPESHLDFHNQFHVLELLEELKEENKMSLLINTHYPEHAMRMADQVLFLGGGSTYTFGNTKEILTEENIERYFHVTSHIDTVTSKEGEVPIFVVTGHLSEEEARHL